MHNWKLLSVFSNYIFLIFFSSVASAVVNVEGTRVVLNSDDWSTSVNLINSGESPSLVQVWTDDGDVFASPQDIKTPVIIVPPMFKLQAKEIRAIKLQIISRDSLSKLKESLFWLNIYQIPSGYIRKEDEMRIVLPIRLRLKILVRPVNIPKPQKEDGLRLKFKIKKDEHNKIVITNPTPWYMSFSKIEFDNYTHQSLMLAPHESKEVSLGKSVIFDKLRYQLINDEGNIWDYETSDFK